VGRDGEVKGRWEEVEGRWEEVEGRWEEMGRLRGGREEVELGEVGRDGGG